MDYSDFEFPPNPSEERGRHNLAPCPSNDVPLQALANTPIDRLPPTTLPTNQQRPIRQAIRANHKLVLSAKSRRRTGMVNQNGENDESQEQKQGLDPNSEGGEGTNRGLHSWRKRPKTPWTEEELVDFYEFLSQYGTDFNAIAVLYANKSREDVKRLYSRELRRQPSEVRAALAARANIDLATFSARLKNKEELKRRAQSRKLDKEEEETLRLLEAGTLQPPCAPKESTELKGHLNVDAEFSFDVCEGSAKEEPVKREYLPQPERKRDVAENNTRASSSLEIAFGKLEETYDDDFVVEWIGKAMQLCYSCRHAFPPSALALCSFSDIISHRFEEIHNIVDSMEMETAEGVHQVLKLRGALRELCSAIHQEFGALREDKPSPESTKRRNMQEQGDLSVPFPNVKPDTHTTLSIPQLPPAMIPRHPHGGCTPRATFNGAVPNHKIRKMNSAFELVSASVYCVLESVAIRARAAVALLWIPPPGAVSAELVAPFVVGRDVSKLRNSAPYRVGETSIPCTVSETGVALNLKPRAGVFDPRASENSPLVDLIETSNAAQLLVPVYTRYGEVQRSVLGVLHLLGTPTIPCPFTQRNEEMAVQTAATLSIMVSSHYEAMGGEWANRIYDPSLLIGAAAYQGTLDMRSTQKVVDDFAPPPILIYRGVNEHKYDDDVREEVKALRNMMTRRSERRQEVYSIKDLQRYAATMEQNWVSLLGTITEMENKVNRLEEDALRTELPKKHQCTSSSIEQGSATHSDSIGLQLSRCQTPSAGALPSLYDARSVIKPEQLNSIEIAVANRLQALNGDPSIFLTEKDA